MFDTSLLPKSVATLC